jgi:hypothetical protein
MIFSKPIEKKSVKGRTKPSEYEAMLRNGFILPKLNSTIVNKIYMYRVKSNQEYCPHVSDIKVYKICINPPSKEYMLNEIHQELTKKGDARDLTYDSKHLPDVEWCEKALLALNQFLTKTMFLDSMKKEGKDKSFSQTFKKKRTNIVSMNLKKDCRPISISRVNIKLKIPEQIKVSQLKCNLKRILSLKHMQRSCNMINSRFLAILRVVKKNLLSKLFRKKIRWKFKSL